MFWFFLKKSLWRHVKTCPFSQESSKYRKIISQAQLLLPTTLEMSEGLKKDVIGRMTADEISIAARNDPTIIKIGEKLYQKHGHLPHLYTHVSQKMRELGRLLLVVRSEDRNITTIKDVIHAQKFPTVIKATRVLCKYSIETNTYGNPSLALKLGHLLKKAAKVCKTDSLIHGNNDLISRCEEFLTLLESEWTDEISSTALRTVVQTKINKGQGLPLTEDIQKLQTFLKNKSVELKARLESDTVTKSDWDFLNQITLANLVLFNRRRGGGTQRLTLEAYRNKRSKDEPIQEILDALKPTEKMLCKTFSRVEIRGKKGRTVPVLFTPTHEENIDILIKTRTKVGVHNDNKYLFARSSFDSLFPIRSADGLRKFAKESGLSIPENVTSTKLRKHVATLSQIMNLSKNDLEIMAYFLGHDIEVHKTFYRPPQETLQVARMGAILSAFDSVTVVTE